MLIIQLSIVIRLEGACNGNLSDPCNEGFQEVLQSEYVDKTGLIALVNIDIPSVCCGVSAWEYVEVYIWICLDCGKGLTR